MVDENDETNDGQEPESTAELVSFDATKRVDSDLYGAADQVITETDLATLGTDFFQTELAKDTEGLAYRPPLLGIDHKGAKFDLKGVGVDDYSPKELKVQVIDHAPNRALWRVKTDPNDKLPICASFDNVGGSILTDGAPTPCARCVFGKWWDPAELLRLVKAKGPKSAPAAAYDYLNKHLKQSDSKIDSVEDAHKRNVADNMNKNLPPCCKEIRRLFLFVYDHNKKGILNQPVVLQVPTSSISNWDKYRQDLALRTITLDDGRRIPMVLAIVITTVSLESIEVGVHKYSKVLFSFDRVASPFMIEKCMQIREKRAESVMKFQMQLTDFDVSEALDPTSLEGVPYEEDPPLGDTMVMPDDDYDPVDDIGKDGKE